MMRYFLIAAMTLPAWGDVVVSPSGDDSNPGTPAKPVASLARAVELSRMLPLGQARRVLLKPGVYFDTTITLTNRDSNLIIQSDESGRATLVGGVPLSGWQKQTERLWSAPLPSGRSWDIRMLQVNGRFCPRARFPETNTLTHLSKFDVPWMSTTGGGWKRKPTREELTTLKYKPGDLPADLDVRSTEITVFHMWDESVAGLSGHDPTNQTLTLSPPLGHPPGAFGVTKYCLWNLPQGMTRPGQWYFDRTQSKIVYWPLPGEDMTRATVIVPTQKTIIRLAGAINVTLRRLNLAVTTVPLVTGGFAAGAFDGALQLEKASAATLSELSVTNVAGHGIKAMRGQSSTRIHDCVITGCGAGGVYISGSDNVVSNTLIYDIGLMFPSAIGIHGGGNNSVLSHNEIHDTTYSAIGFGGERIVIENNLIYRCMKVMHDGAAIYTFGSKDTVLRNNFAHDIIDTGGYGASAYYLDERCQNCVVENNVSLNVARPSHNHMATNNVIRHNVFITQGDMRITFPRCTGFSLEQNVLYASGSITFEGINHVTNWSKNLLYSGSGKINGTALADYSKRAEVSGVCGDTQVGDPLFMNLSTLKLTYQPQSPAVNLSLKPLDVSVAGRK